MFPAHAPFVVRIEQDLEGRRRQTGPEFVSEVTIQHVNDRGRKTEGDDDRARPFDDFGRKRAHKDFELSLYPGFENNVPNGLKRKNENKTCADNDELKAF